MSETHSQDWGNYWQGRAAQSSGEALVGVGIEHNSDLKAFWTNLFIDAPASARVVDFACGAGSALKHADVAGMSDLTGVDIAEDAIAVLKTSLPNVDGIISSVTQTPLTDNQFDIVVSQFGFEYAGGEANVLQTAGEMARVLKPEGQFAAIAHMKGGAIERESLDALNHIKHVQRTGFIDAANHMFVTAEKADRVPTPLHQENFMKALVAMNQAENSVTSWLQAQESSNTEFAKFGRFLVEATRKSFEHRQKLPLAECTDWLDKMNLEISAYEGRMRSMVSAALSKDMAERVLAEFSAVGFEVPNPEPFFFAGSGQAVAWVLKAE